MNCALALRMLDAYIDDELDTATGTEIADHLATCASCAALRVHRVAVRSALRTASLRHVAPVELRKAVLRRIDAAAQPAVRNPAARWWQFAALGTSTAIAGIIAGWFLAQMPGPGTIPEEMVARHVASLTPEGPRVDLASADRHVVRPWFQGRLEFSPAVRDLSSQGFDLVGARLDRVGPRAAGAVVYRLRGHVINVFSWRGVRDAAPVQPEATVRGFHVVRWADGDLQFAAVSDSDSAELRRFSDAYRAP